jgi:hypothetical protein
MKIIFLLVCFLFSLGSVINFHLRSNAKTNVSNQNHLENKLTSSLQLQFSSSDSEYVPERATVLESIYSAKPIKIQARVVNKINLNIVN